jgi:mRNA interferase MazF
MNIKIKRGEVWWVNFDPSIAGEIQKTRPALVISNDYANEYSNRVQVVPLTSSVVKCYPCEAYITIDGKKSKAMADQIMTVSKERLKNKIGVVMDKEIYLVERAIKVQLSLQKV